MEWVLNLIFSSEYIEFLSYWQDHVVWIAVAICCWTPIVRHLFKTEHAKLEKDGKNDHIVCGDIRVSGWLTIFGGSAGLSFGLPYYWLADTLHLTGFVREYWMGFVYLQFGLSLVQSLILVGYSLFVPSKKWWRLLKAHLKGCGWISALSPIGWILYWIQQKLPNEVKFLMWVPRDVETIFVFVFSLFGSPLIYVCLLASVVGTVSHLKLKLIFPLIWWIDHDHTEDEDSSEKK